ncbi:MAG: glycosyl transferase group 1 [Spartobacteria bacterium]|nr:glycosyl transferase group 1 [Spartobacteria bacterium]
MEHRRYLVKAMVLLIGNYSLDQQQSMQRFAAMMLQGLTASRIPAELIQPTPMFGRFRWAGRFVTKWLAYVDKYILFPLQLKRRLTARPALVHICDHSNAVYAKHCRDQPVLVTCHDLLAVRGALGEQTDCPASLTGRLLQRWILNGLGHADAIICDSAATAADAKNLIGRNGRPRIDVVLLGLSYPYKKLATQIARDRLAPVGGLDSDLPFFLHVGSNLRRKNRDGVLRIFARLKDQWNGQLVFAGEPLDSSLQNLARDLGVENRVREVVNPTNELLEALYNCAVALLYPSRFEGFGWPIIEAQACGCPVICSTSGPLPEVAGQAGRFHSVEDEAGFASDLLRMLDPAEREKWSEESLHNSERFSSVRMIAHYIEFYRLLGAGI